MLRGAGGDEKTLIQRSWEAACAVDGAERVVVATDDDRIADAARGFGAEVTMTPANCANGTERCAATLKALGDDVDVIVNVQGDAPLTPPHFVEALLARMADPAVMMATPAIRTSGDTQRRLLADQDAGRVGGTTVVLDRDNFALYFSKAVIPHVPAARVGDPTLPIYFHVGAYAYTRAALECYAAAPVSSLEELEGLEQLRFLDLRVPVAVVEVDSRGADIWELNNPEDVAVIETALAARGIA